MKSVFQSVKAVFLRGLFLVVPVMILLLLLKHLIGAIHILVRPFAERLPFEAAFPGLWAVLTFVGLCLLVGGVMLIPPINRQADLAERYMMGRFPLYSMIRGISGAIFGSDTEKKVQPALVVIEDAFVPALVTEIHESGDVTAFVPATPSIFQGQIYILNPKRVHYLDMGLGKFVRCSSRWGMGSAELMKAMRVPARSPG